MCAGDPYKDCSHFKKVTLILFQDDGKPGQYYTDESFDEDDDPTVFYVEIKE